MDLYHQSCHGLIPLGIFTFYTNCQHAAYVLSNYFRVALKFCKKSNFDQNQPKLSTQLGTCIILYEKKILKWRIISGEIWPKSTGLIF